MTMNDKQFDCIKMKNDIQKQIYNETKDMSVRELLHYFNRKEKSMKESNSKQPSILSAP